MYSDLKIIFVYRRKVALQYLELTQREIEYVALSRDTTEADLKQRREIQHSTAKYFDQVKKIFTINRENNTNEDTVHCLLSYTGSTQFS